MDELKVAIFDRDKDRIKEVLDKVPSISHVAQILCADGICLLSELCKLGFTDLMEQVISNGVDIHDANKQENLISKACEHNQVATLEYLLSKYPELPILPEGVEAWQERSPFCITSKRGQGDLLLKLYANSPGLVKQDDVRASLLYTSCQGGSAACFKLWISPGININNSISLIQSEKDFGNFEKHTPLYAVCSGGHKTLLFYIKNNFPSLEFNQTACNDYPDLIGEIVEEWFAPVKPTGSGKKGGLDESNDDDDEVFQMCIGYLQQRNLHMVHASWILPHTVTLQELHLSGNMLTELPKCLPWEFQNLQKLDVSRNNLKYFLGPIKDGLYHQPLCPRLKDINLSYNKLETVCVEMFCIPTVTSLNLSHNKLSFLVKSIHQDADLQQDRDAVLNRKSLACNRVRWDCGALRRLDISNNALQMIPMDIMECRSLCYLIAKQNNLTTFPQPWECPLEHLDLSHNQLERFPVDTEKYWCSSLKYLNLSDNRLDEINEGIVKLSVLTDLNAANNRIERLPVSEVWGCGHLHLLNLKNNKLGLPTDKSPSKISGLKSPFRNRLSLSTEGSSLITFPDILSTCLKELRLPGNNLDSVPPSVCNLKLLEILDLSDNPLIRSLPIQMGKLKNCGVLKLKGLNIDNIKDISTEGGLSNTTKRILTNFMEKLRECKEYNKLKTIVLGKKDKGKTTLVNILANKKGNSQQGNKSITRGEVITKRKTSFSLLQSEKKTSEVKLNVWDIAGDESYTMIHHSMFTRHTLYLLVWDFWSIESELEEIGKWLYNIQATSQFYSVVLIGTFLDKRPAKDDEVERLEREISLKLQAYKLKRTPPVCAVSCVNSRGIDRLKEVINNTAQSMRLPGRKSEPVVTRKVPKSYLDLEKAIIDKTGELMQNNKPLVLTQAEFTELLESVKDEHLLSSEETQNVTEFLRESGSLLHFCDQLGALNTLYFLDPAWFCDVLVHILINPEGKRKLKEGKGKISRSEVEKIYRNHKSFPNALIDQYIEMLERFEIAVATDNNQKLFFPCQLPENPPLCDSSDNSRHYKKICRLYRMAECPSGFWTRLLTRMMTRVEHFSKSQWYYQPMVAQSVRKATIRNPSFKDLRQSGTYHGLHLKNVTKTYCREWLYVQHEEGSFCVEPVTPGGSDDGYDAYEDELQKGILITEIDKTEKFAVTGVIVDEIEDIIHDFYPGLLEPSDNMQLQLKRFALCSFCYSKDQTVQHIEHFTMEHCARMLVEGDYISCPRGDQHRLDSLVPDLLMKELPDKFILDRKKLHVVESEEHCLGGGVAGSVFKGTYGDREIAVKIYRSDIRHTHNNLLSSGSYNSNSSDSGTATISTQGSGGLPAYVEDRQEKIYANCSEIFRKNVDLDETESIKAFKALKEMRQEVALTSRLQHPCIISLVGILFSPKLMMALELAPLGSLRDILDKQQENRPVFRKYLDKEKDFPPIFEKELTFKFVHQIAKGLDYLHSYGIIYKDLKSDNILTMSLDLEATVNLKLSDYGISKYSWGGRSVGLVGTPGYQAPEILDGLPYDEKVDIFSMSMVIYEILTGNRPFMEYDNVGQISKAIKTDEKRPSIQEFRVSTHFPYLEELMVSCWQKSAANRPKAASIVTKKCMQNVQFVAQRSTATFDAKERLTFAEDAVIGASANATGLPTLWIWEGVDTERCFTVIDMEKSSYRFKKSPFPGPRVLCMSIVEKQVWIGTENSTIKVCGAESGKLEEKQTITLTGQPLCILPYIKKIPGEKHVTVYVAENDGHLLKYEKQTNKNVRFRRPTQRHVEGYSEPKVCTLRSENIHCMALANRNTDLWISHSSYIDIVSCAEFKVTSDSRINIEVLNSICKLPKSLSVCDMTSNDTQVFCLLEVSPLVYEFDNNGNCVSVIRMGERSVLKKNVLSNLKLSVYDHEGYHGHIVNSSRNSKSSLSSTESDNDEEGFKPLAVKTVTKRFEGSMSFWKNQSVQDKALPPVPPRIGAPVGKQDPNRPPDIPPRPCKLGQGHGHKVASDDSYINLEPPVSGRVSAGTKPGSSPNIPAIPPRSPVINKEEVPVVPPRSPILGTSCENEGSRTFPLGKQNDGVGLVYPSKMRLTKSRARPMTLYPDQEQTEKALLRQKGSQSLPNMDSVNSKGKRAASMFDFHITSLQLVEDSLWVGRSYGDVCVVDVNCNLERRSRGQVVACMKDLNDKHRETMNKNPNLLKVGDYMATAFTIETDTTECFEMASWDCHGADFFRTVDRFWTDVMTSEKELANEAAGQYNGRISDLGSY